MNKSALTLTLLTVSLLTVLASAFIVESVQANPDWTNEDAVWKDVKTITGTGNQKVSASVPNPSFIRVVGTCNTIGDSSKISLTYDGGGTGGGTLYTFAEVGLHEISSNSYSVQTNPATVTVTISVENVTNYNLVLQYDQGAPVNTPTPTPKPTSNSNNSPTPSPASSPLSSPTASPTDSATSSPTASPTETETPGEPFPTLTVIALVVPLALVIVGGTTFWMYRKKNHP